MQTARPGHRLPHAWLERDGEIVGTHQLLRPGTFLLLTGRDGTGWPEVAARHGADLYRVGHDLRDPGDRWARLRGHDEDGAVLVRPDGFVAARFLGGEDPQDWLARALAVATGRAAVEIAS